MDPLNRIVFALIIIMTFNIIQKALVNVFLTLFKSLIGDDKSTVTDV